MRIDEPPERVAVAIFTHLVHQWDPNVHLERRVMAIDDRAEVSWEQWRSPLPFVDHRDFALLRARAGPATYRASRTRQSWVHGCMSITHPAVPERDGIVRAELYKSGYVVAL